MAFPILGTPRPQFSDSTGVLASGTLSILDPSDDSNATYYPTADDADAGTNGQSGDITLNANGYTPDGVFGTNTGTYKLVLKDSSGSTIWTEDDVHMPGDPGRITYNQGGTGAADRTLEARLQDVVSIEDFNPTGDGSADDTTALNNFFTACQNKIGICPDGSKTFKFTGQLTIPNNATILFNGATLQADYNPGQSTIAISGGTGLWLEHLNITISTSYVVDRVIGVGANSKVDRLKITSTDQQANTDANLDGAFRITGDNVEARKIHIEDYDRSIVVTSADNVTLSSVYITDFVRGIWVNTCDYFTLDGYICHTKSANATTDPGHNGLLVSECRYSKFMQLDIGDAGEHGIRVGTASTNASRNISFANVQVSRPGQCGFKIQDTSGSLRTTEVIISGLTVVDCSFGGASSSNEDGIRIMNADNVLVTGFTVMKRDNAGTSAYDGIYIEDSTDVTIISPNINDVANHGIHITDGGSAVDMNRIFIRSPQIITTAGDGIQVDVATASSTLRDVILTDIFVRNQTGYAFEIDSTDAIITQPVIVTGYAKADGSGVSNEVTPITDTLLVTSITTVS